MEITQRHGTYILVFALIGLVVVLCTRQGGTQGGVIPAVDTEVDRLMTHGDLIVGDSNVLGSAPVPFRNAGNPLYPRPYAWVPLAQPNGTTLLVPTVAGT